MKDQRQALSIPLATGMDAGTEPHLVDKANLVVWNGETNRDRAIGRRYGTAQIAGDYTEAKFVGEADGTALIAGDRIGKASVGTPTSPTLLTYGASFSSAAVAPMLKAEVKRLFTPIGATSASYVACAENATHILVASWMDGATNRYVDYAVTEKVTGRITSTGQVFYSWCPPHVLCTDNGMLFLLMGPNDATGAMGGVPFDANGVALAPVGFTMDTAFPQPDSGTMDAAPVGDDKIAIGLRDNATNDAVCVIVDLATTNQVGNHYQDNAVGTTEHVAVLKWPGSANKVLFLYRDSGAAPDTLNGVVLNATTGAVEYAKGTLAHTDVDNMKHLTCQAADSATEEVLAFWDARAANTRPKIRFAPITITTAGAVSIGSRVNVSYGGELYARPAVDRTNKDIYLPVFFQGGRWWSSAPTSLDAASTQRTYYLIKINKTGFSYCAMAAKWLQWFAGHTVAEVVAPTATLESYWTVGDIGSYAGQVSYVPALERSKQIDGPRGIAAVKVNFNYTDIRPVNAHGALVVPCAFPVCTGGGRSFIDLAVEFYPDTIDTATSGAGGTWGKAGSVGFAVEYQFRTFSGVLVRGVPSWVERQAVAATDGVTVTYETCYFPCLGMKSGTARTVVYATELDIAQYFQILTGTCYSTSETLTTAAYNGGATLYATDGDGNYQATASPLYTQDGVLECIAPNHHYLACVWANRYWYVDGDHPDTIIRPSREFEAGYQIPFTDVIDVTIEPEGGDMTMIAGLGDRLIIGKSSRTYVLMGQGPDPTGGTNAWAPPRRISDRVGCTNRMSSVVTPKGLAFLAADGLWIIGQDEQLDYIGKAVKHYTDTYTITGAVCSTERHLVLWTTSAGPALVWDYLTGNWSIWTGNYSSVRAVGYAQGHVYLLKGSALYLDDLSNYMDAGTTFQFRVRTQWIKAAGVAGYIEARRAILHGYNLNQGKLHAAVAFDYAPAFSEVELSLADVLPITRTDHYSTALSPTTYDKQALVTHIPIYRHKVSAICFDIWDEDSPTKTCELTALSLVAEPKARPDAPIGAGKRFVEV